MRCWCNDYIFCNLLDLPLWRYVPLPWWRLHHFQWSCFYLKGVRSRHLLAMHNSLIVFPLYLSEAQPVYSSINHIFSPFNYPLCNPDNHPLCNSNNITLILPSTIAPASTTAFMIFYSLIMPSSLHCLIIFALPGILLSFSFQLQTQLNTHRIQKLYLYLVAFQWISIIIWLIWLLPSPLLTRYIAAPQFDGQQEESSPALPILPVRSYEDFIDCIAMSRCTAFCKST